MHLVPEFLQKLNTFIYFFLIIFSHFIFTTGNILCHQITLDRCCFSFRAAETQGKVTSHILSIHIGLRWTYVYQPWCVYCQSKWDAVSGQGGNYSMEGKWILKKKWIYVIYHEIFSFCHLPMKSKISSANLNKVISKMYIRNHHQPQIFEHAMSNSLKSAVCLEWPSSWASREICRCSVNQIWVTYMQST